MNDSMTISVQPIYDPTFHPLDDSCMAGHMPQFGHNYALAMTEPMVSETVSCDPVNKIDLACPVREEKGFQSIGI